MQEWEKIVVAFIHRSKEKNWNEKNEIKAYWYTQWESNIVHLLWEIYKVCYNKAIASKRKYWLDSWWYLQYYYIIICICMLAISLRGIRNWCPYLAVKTRLFVYCYCYCYCYKLRSDLRRYINVRVCVVPICLVITSFSYNIGIATRHVSFYSLESGLSRVS